MESKRLKQRLARLFRASFLRRSPCSYSTSTSSSSIFSSTTTAAGSTSSRRSVSPSIAVVEPVFLPRNDADSAVDIPPFLRGSCRPARASSERNLEPASPTSPKKDYFYYNNNNNKKKKKKNVRSKKKLLSNGYGFSSSSDDDEEGLELFSSGGEQYIVETLFSSSCRSFCSDSSEFYSSSRRKKKKKKSMNKENVVEQNKNPSRRPPRPNESCEPVGGGSAGRATCGVPVTKRSRDPYVDFRDSMAEMVAERRIFGTEGLEELLHSYLSLNSSRHHPVILRAFGDIAQVLSGQ